MQPPKLHDRGLSQLIADSEALAQIYTPGWSGYNDPADPGRELIELGARLVELLAERVNRAPEKNFLAFLDFVGVERSPGMAAEAPVTFVLSNRSSGEQVPERTQVATTQSEGNDAQVFETRNAFFATPARLAHVLGLQPTADRFAQLSPLSLPPKAEELADKTRHIEILGAAAAGTLVEHALCLASGQLFGRKEPTDIRLTFTIANGNRAIFDPQYLSWQRFDSELEVWEEIQNVTYALVGSSQVTVSFAAFPGTGKTEAGGSEDFWIIARLKVAPASTPGLPTISALTGEVTAPQAAPTAPDAVLGNQITLDPSRPMYPFGARPRYGDAFQVASAKAFGPGVGQARLRMTLRPYTLTELQAIFATAPGAQITTVVEWQYLATGGLWKTLGSFAHTLTVSNVTPLTFAQSAGQVLRDGTFFGNIGTAGPIEFTFTPQSDMAVATVGGISSRWVRAVLRSQDPYGRDGSVKVVTNTVTVTDPTFIPPIIEQIEIHYTYATSPGPLDGVATVNNFTRDVRSPPFFPTGQPIQPFVALQSYAPASGGAPAFGSAPALYLAFDRPFGNAFISLLIAFAEAESAAQLLPEAGNPHVVWEYLTDIGWKPLDVQDSTADLTSSGIVGFQAPADVSPAILLPQLTQQRALYWYRARLAAGSYTHLPRLRAVLPNSVMADNRQTQPADWVLASGTGEPNQRATILRRPVLSGDIWVRETEIPTEAARQELLDDLTIRAIEAGDDRKPVLGDIVDERPTTDGERAVWVRWMRVPNFRVSGPRSRHYTLEAASGEVTFGDGIGGLTLPIGKDNVVVRDLVSGGGEVTNRVAPPMAIKELKTSLPFVDKVFNLEAAVGGADPWSLDRTYELGPQAIKNLGRAVTIEDYAWITLSNFSQVARAKCLATTAPDLAGNLAFKPGAVSVVVVPKGTEAAPQPPKGLLRRIEAFLSRRALGAIAAEIHALPPAYLAVSVAASVRPKLVTEASVVERRVVRALEAFFHPLTGGEQREGWPFGRSVYLSEVFAVIERTEGIDYVVAASFVDHPGATQINVGPNALVASGLHVITMV